MSVLEEPVSPSDPIVAPATLFTQVRVVFPEFTDAVMDMCEAVAEHLDTFSEAVFDEGWGGSRATPWGDLAGAVERFREIAAGPVVVETPA